MLVTCHLLIRPKPEPSKAGADGKADGKVGMYTLTPLDP
jgi:hypothetical protein